MHKKGKRRQTSYIVYFLKKIFFPFFFSLFFFYVTGPFNKYSQVVDKESVYVIRKNYIVNNYSYDHHNLFFLKSPLFLVRQSLFVHDPLLTTVLVVNRTTSTLVFLSMSVITVRITAPVTSLHVTVFRTTCTNSYVLCMEKLIESLESCHLE